MRSARGRATTLLFALTLATGMGVGRAYDGPPFPLRPLEPPPPPRMAELERKRVLLNAPARAGGGDRTGSAEALVLFEQPLERVLDLLAATARQREYRPELRGLKVVESHDGVDVVEYRVRFMMTKLSYRTRQTVDREAGLIWWTLDPDHPKNGLATLDGLWELHPLDERRTLGRFRTRIDIGPALPAFLQDYATRRRLPESMQDVRRWIDSDGRWRP